MKTIMIIEKESIVALDLEQRLRAEGYKVHSVVSDSDEAVKKIAAERPDLVISSLKLIGDINGLTLAGVLNGHYDLPILFLTGSPNEQLQSFVEQNDRVLCLHKPFRDEDFKAAIEKLQS